MCQAFISFLFYPIYYLFGQIYNSKKEESIIDFDSITANSAQKLNLLPKSDLRRRVRPIQRGKRKPTKNLNNIVENLIETREKDKNDIFNEEKENEEHTKRLLAMSHSNGLNIKNLLGNVKLGDVKGSLRKVQPVSRMRLSENEIKKR